jgi:hypothetical protein
MVVNLKVPTEGGVKQAPESPPTGANEAPPADTQKNPDAGEVWIWRATDDEGLSDHLQFRCQAGAARFMSSILYSGRFPYGTESDILRHALHRHIEWLKTHPGCPDAPATLLSKLNRMWEEEQSYMAFEDTLRRAGDLINHAMAHGMMRRARRIAKDLLNEVMKMKDSECRGFFEGQIRKHFGNLLGG